VQPLVHDHLVPLRKGLLTILARVGSRVRVDPFVFSQEVASLKVLWTVSALVRPLASVRAPVVKLKLCKKEDKGEMAQGVVRPGNWKV
jgi:hypothetical protein